jgi:phosphatidylserine/phosphatidylglycerophosphate/cardiolipin synthase-like enzyme
LGIRWEIMILSSLVALFLTGCAPAGNTVLPGAPHPAQTYTDHQIAAPDHVAYAFTQAGQHPEALLEEVIGSAKTSLDIAIYSITKKDILDAILSAKARGVNVRVITDRQEARGKYQAADLRRLRDAGIPVKVNTHPGLMHLKVTIADQSVLTTGSYNYTVAASTTNDEVLVVIRDPAIAKEWDAQFERMWDDTSQFADWH